MVIQGCEWLLMLINASYLSGFVTKNHCLNLNHYLNHYLNNWLSCSPVWLLVVLIWLWMVINGYYNHCLNLNHYHEHLLFANGGVPCLPSTAASSGGSTVVTDLPNSAENLLLQARRWSSLSLWILGMKILWVLVDSHGFLWNPYGIPWNPMDSHYGFLWYP